MYYQNVSQSIINNKNNFFISADWTRLRKEINIKLKLFTMYYPQTNNQIEKTIKCWNNIYNISS